MHTLELTHWVSHLFFQDVIAPFKASYERKVAANKAEAENCKKDKRIGQALHCASAGGVSKKGRRQTRSDKAVQRLSKKARVT